MTIHYICDFCKREYTSREAAENCEATGMFDNTFYDIGTMFRYGNGHDYTGIFAVAKVEVYHSNKHLGQMTYWACRAPNYPGDSVGDERCGGDFVRTDRESTKQWIKHHTIDIDDLERPEFKRMVKFLKSVNITPRYHDKQGELIIIK